jgi:hypothetical protein
MWNGEQWVNDSPVFRHTGGTVAVSEMTVFDPDGSGPLTPRLAVVGFFNRIGTTVVGNAAYFDGKQWQPMGSGFPSNPLALGTWRRDGDDVVVVGGFFDSAGGVPARCVASWEGTAWAPVGAGLNGSPTGGFVNFDIDGPGPRPSMLYAAGDFSQSDGRPMPGIARWNGTEWEDVAGSLNIPQAPALAVLETNAPQVCVGGLFQAAGGAPSAFFARFGGVDCCPGDFNQDGGVTSSDFFQFLEAFFREDPAADINSDGAVNTVDFFDFLVVFFDGC